MPKTSEQFTSPNIFRLPIPENNSFRGKKYPIELESINKILFCNSVDFLAFEKVWLVIKIDLRLSNCGRRMRMIRFTRHLYQITRSKGGSTYAGLECVCQWNVVHIHKRSVRTSYYIRVLIFIRIIFTRSDVTRSRGSSCFGKLIYSFTCYGYYVCNYLFNLSQVISAIPLRLAP